MSRLIDADALKDTLLTYFSLEDGGTAMQMAAIRAVDSAPTVAKDINVPGWISVKDRLPEKHVDVLINVLCDSGDFVSTAWLEDRGWNDDAGGWSNDDVTHWMPLPEPPEEEA